MRTARARIRARGAEGYADLRYSARTSWLLLAQDLNADLLVPGADASTVLYNSPTIVRQAMWWWWAGFWFSDRLYSGAEMRSAFACPIHSMPHGAHSTRAVAFRKDTVLDVLKRLRAQRSAAQTARGDGKRWRMWKR